jgi:hypothetical protein
MFLSSTKTRQEVVVISIVLLYNRKAKTRDRWHLIPMIDRMYKLQGEEGKLSRGEKDSFIYTFFLTAEAQRTEWNHRIINPMESNRDKKKHTEVHRTQKNRTGSRRITIFGIGNAIGENLPDGSGRF